MAEMAEDFDREIKVLVIGNGGVGKTSMIRRFCKGVFTDEYKKTIGVDFLEKAQFVDALQEEVRFMLWDTAGQEEFDAITRTYYRGAGAAVLAFSTTDRLSFDAIATWKSKVENECGDIAMCLVQNKVDLIDQAVADAEEVEALARKLGLRLYRTCVKQNVNVAEVFVYLAELHQRKLAAGQLNSQPATPAINNMGGGGGGGSAGVGGAFSGGSAFGAPAAQAGGGVEEVGQDEGTDADAAAGPPAPVPAAAAAPAPAPQARTVNVGPSKVRTGGKKSFKEKLTKCSLA